jgi:FKBP-type peptidyl-prolyl cis-trans isomerase 2
MKFNKKDFIEIEFTGKVKDGEVFDSNIKENLEKLNPDAKAKPFVFCIGERMFLESIDDFLMKDEIEFNKNFEVELTPEKAFGNRDSKLVKLIPMNIFREKQVNPRQGMVFDFDGTLGKVIAVSGGRVMVDFNNPLAGKIVVYDIKVLRKIDDINEKVKAIMNFFFQREFQFEVKDNKLIISAEKPFSDYLNIFKEKFKEILELDTEVKEIVKETETKKEEVTSKE